MRAIRESVIVKNRQIVINLPDDFDVSKAEVIILSEDIPETKTTSPELKKIRPLGILKGKAVCRIKDDFKMTDEELSGYEVSA